MNSNPNVSIIILNWNGWNDTIECLESLRQITYQNYEIIVIDNGSKDESINKIREYCDKVKTELNSFTYLGQNMPIKTSEIVNEDMKWSVDSEMVDNLSSNKKITVIKNDKNYGFPEGNNIGIRYALSKSTDYILLLNNDVVVDKDFVIELVNTAERDPKFGIIGSKIYDYYEPNCIQCAGGKINWMLGNIKEYKNLKDSDDCKASERDFVWATSVLIKKEVFKAIGFLDPFFFFGIEEYDFCSRAKKAGFNVIYDPTSIIWHKKGSSFRKLSDYPDVKKMILDQRGFLLYKHYYKLFKKHAPPIIYLVPYSIFMTRQITYLSTSLLKNLVTLNFKKIMEGYKMLK